MKISGVGPAGGAKKSSAPEKTSKTKGAFKAHLSGFLGELGEIHAADAPTPVTDVDSILAAQTVGDSLSEETRRRLMRRGEELLDRMEEIRHGLLRGHIPKDRLIQIAQMVRQKREQGTDPQLAAILDEIELRAEVELAKLSRAL
ncbi:MAG: flagellar assembly protein FliX [Alphaproteobacteria bacterium RIFOXYD12_FULL_60_8]|nr:MAG: flagellar assembly protein FliX [Alphaproteobacteria bacterium RIFOXYD12_FULL_60_8]